MCITFVYMDPQMENEYGFCGSDKVYLRHLVATARQWVSTLPLFTFSL